MARTALRSRQPQAICSSAWPISEKSAKDCRITFKARRRRISGLTYTTIGICLMRYMKLLQIYRCFCDETRLRILHLLAQGPLCVCHFQDILRLPQVAVSKHLAYLRAGGLVTAQRHEKWMIYR